MSTMPSKITGNYDIGIEVSTRLIGRHLNDRLVGVHRSSGVELRIAAVTASVDDADGGEVRLRVAAKISHGSITLPPHGIRLRPLRIDVEALVPMKLELTADGRGAQLRARSDDFEIKCRWASEEARNAFYDPKLFMIPPPPGDESLLETVVLGELRRLLAQPFVIPGIALGPSQGAALEAIEARSLASRVVIGANLASRENTSLASKKRSVLVDPDHVALTLSPELVHDAIVCPMLARELGVGKQDLCATCGGAPTTSLKDQLRVDIERLDLTGIEVQCVAGALLLTLHMEAETGSYSGTGTARFRVALDVHAGRLRARAALDHVDFEVDSDVWSWLLTHGKSEAIAEGVEAIAETMVRDRLGSGIEKSFELPTTLGDQAVRVERVVIDEDGITVFASSPGYPLAREPHVAISVIDTVLRQEVRDTGLGGATCVRRNYKYERLEVDHAIHLEAMTANLAEPTAFRWTLAGLGFASGHALALPAAAHSEDPADDPGFVVVVPTLSAGGRTLTVQTRAQDGNYDLDVRCIADDGLDAYEASRTVEVQGRVARYEDAYARDKVHCASQKVVPLPQPQPQPGGGPRFPFTKEPWGPTGPGPGPEILRHLDDIGTRLGSAIARVSRAVRERLRSLARPNVVRTNDMRDDVVVARRAARPDGVG